MTNKKIVCAIVWVVGLPLRLFLTLTIGTLSLLGVPLWLLMEAHEWACNDGEFGDSYWAIPKLIWWDFLVLGRWEL